MTPELAMLLVVIIAGLLTFSLYKIHVTPEIFTLRNIAGHYASCAVATGLVWLVNWLVWQDRLEQAAILILMQMVALVSASVGLAVLWVIQNRRRALETSLSGAFQRQPLPFSRNIMASETAGEPEKVRLEASAGVLPAGIRLEWDNIENRWLA